MSRSEHPHELVLTRAVSDALFAHARAGVARSPPVEVCGVLAGSRSPPSVTESHRVSNVAPDPRRRYALDPEATLAVVEAIEAAGDDVVGFYHSHPESPARPSTTDCDEATWTDHVYVILSPAEDDLSAWRWTGEAFESLDVVVD